MKFKIGDKVRVKRDKAGEDTNKIGKIISSPHGVYDYEVKGDSFTFNSFDEDELELVEEKKEHKFKVGDRVIINEQDKYFGKVGIVTKEAYGLRMGGNVTLTIDGEEGIIVLGDDLALVETPQREEVKEEERFDNHEEHVKIHVEYSKNYQPKKTLMKKVSTLARKLFDADTRVLVEEGKNVLLDMLFLQYKKQMATEARKAIREAKKQCEEDEDEE